MGALISMLTGRLAVYALAASVALGAISTAWEYVGKAEAEKTAETANATAARAMAQAQTLTTSLRTQNDAVQALHAQLADAQSSVDNAQERARLAEQASQNRIAVIRTVKVPADCPGAVANLADYLSAPAQRAGK